MVLSLFPLLITAVPVWMVFSPLYFGKSLVDSFCCKGQVPYLMPCTAAKWPRIFINAHIMRVPLGTSEDQ